MKAKGYAINGKFLCEKITGMQRVAIELVNELDKICKKGEYSIVIPEIDDIALPNYKNISIVRFGKMNPSKKGSSILWEQYYLPKYLKKNNLLGVHLLSIVPLVYPHGMVLAHGVNYKVNPQFFKTRRDKASRLWHIINFRCYFKHTEKIGTVSYFSQSEISRVYKIPKEKITVICNAWQHEERIVAAGDTFEKFPFLTPGNYYFSMSSVNDNKNFRWIAQVALKNPDSQFAIAGGRSLGEYLKRSGIEQAKNLHFLGYVTDEDAKTLMGNCKAFLFPTFYEGFGIPPLEAMFCGATQAIVSDTTTMHEVYEDTVHYIDPLNPNVDLDAILSEPVADKQKALDKYSWAKSAEILYDLLRKDA